MKLVFTLSLTIIVFTVSLSFSQNKKTCETKSNEIIQDLSNITKCSVEQVKDKNNKYGSELKLSYRKVRRRNNTVKKVSKRASNKAVKGINTTQNDVSNNLGSNKVETLNLKNFVSSKAILFSVVDEVPVFSKCSLKKDKRKCFNNQISKHFGNNFYPERATDEAFKGKILVQFTINYQGNVSNILIKSKKKITSLEKEIKRVINKLPSLTPGSHKGLPVNVKYRIPINIDIN